MYCVYMFASHVSRRHPLSGSFFSPFSLLCEFSSYTEAISSKSVSLSLSVKMPLVSRLTMFGLLNCKVLLMVLGCCNKLNSHC